MISRLILTAFFLVSTNLYSAGYSFKTNKVGLVKAQALPTKKMPKKRQLEKNTTLELNPDNTIVFRSVFTDASVAEAIAKLFKMSAKLSDSETIYLVLNTPGGSVYAGGQLISAARAIPQEVKTVTLFAASMGFITAQSLGERLIMPIGTFMSHRATLSGLSGQVNGEIESRLEWIKSGITAIDRRMAERTNLTFEKYQAKIVNEWWTEGAQAVEQKTADRVVNLVCSKKSLGTYKEQVQTFFGAFIVEWSNCPLISSPLKVTPSKELERLPLNQYIKVFKEVNHILTAPKLDVLETYVKTNKYKELLK